MSSDVSGRTILITGASSGLGEHFAKLMAAAGAKVVVAARRIDRLQNLVEQIRHVNGTAIAVSMDVTNEDSIIRAFDQAEREVGPVDSLIANAGISHVGSALAIEADDFDHIMAVNVRGAFLTAREGARRMIERKAADGRITLIASIGGLAPLAGLTAYSTSKAAVVMLGQSLAREWMNKGINVNVVCPGYIRTELNSAWFDSEQGQRQIASFPRRRLMEDSQLDDILLLTSGLGSRFITGSVFKIDDGQLLA
tara:strand:+ start:14786 stop:15544 length:759 start_codon:yes stop_codon:yes gene_type:complete